MNTTHRFQAMLTLTFAVIVVASSLSPCRRGARELPVGSDQGAPTYFYGGAGGARQIRPGDSLYRAATDELATGWYTLLIRAGDYSAAIPLIVAR